MAALAQNTHQNSQWVVAQDNSSRSTQYGQFVNKRNKFTVSVISGGINSTYLQMATDMANVLDGQEGDATLRVVPVVGKGGEQNVMDILYSDFQVLSNWDMDSH